MYVYAGVYVRVYILHVFLHMLNIKWFIHVYLAIDRYNFDEVTYTLSYVVLNHRHTLIAAFIIHLSHILHIHLLCTSKMINLNN